MKCEGVVERWEGNERRGGGGGGGVEWERRKPTGNRTGGVAGKECSNFAAQ